MNQNVLDTLILSEITLRRITVMLDDEQVSSRWVIDNPKEGGITPRFPFHYPICFIPSLARRLHFLGQYSSYLPCQMNLMGSTSRQIVLVMLSCIYADHKGFQTSRGMMFFFKMVLFMSYPILCVFEYSTEICDALVFCLCVLVRNVVCLLVFTADSRVQVCVIRAYES